MSKKTPLVSILMPVYNSYDNVRSEGRDLLSIALKSLLNQTYLNIEIIILDNQSTDSTPEICQKFALKDKRIRYIRDTKNRFPEAAIGRLARLARGEYCMTANDDDVWESDFVETLMNEIIKDHDIDLCYSNAKNIDINGNKSSQIVEWKYSYDSNHQPFNNFIRFIAIKNIIPLAFGIYRTSSFVSNLPFQQFDELKADVDNLFMSKFMLKGGKIKFVDKVLFYYRTKERALDPSKVIGMPGLDTPELILFYYVRHQFELYKQIKNLINKYVSTKFKREIAAQAAFNSLISTTLNLISWILDKIASGDKAIILQNITNEYQGLNTNIKSPPYLDLSNIYEYQVADSVVLKQVNSYFLSNKKLFVNLLNRINSEFKAKNDELIHSLHNTKPLINKSVKRKIKKTTNHNPLICVIVTSYNLKKYLKTTIDSILAQTLSNIEIIIVDGKSTDGSIEVIQEYGRKFPSKIKYLIESDSGYPEAFLKGVRLSKSDIITQCAVSDGYAVNNWLEIAYNTLRSNNGASLVWGYPQYIDEKSNIGNVSYPQFKYKRAPNDFDFYEYWLNTGFHFPEGNLVVWKNVLVRCYPSLKEISKETLDWLEFSYRFHKFGYLSKHIPVIANFGRRHDGQMGDRLEKNKILTRMINNYQRKVVLSRILSIIYPSKMFISHKNELIINASINRIRLCRTMISLLLKYFKEIVQSIKNQVYQKVKIPITIKVLDPIYVFCMKMAYSIEERTSYEISYQSLKSKYSNQKIIIRHPIYGEATRTTAFDRHYIYFPSWALRTILTYSPTSHIDISSTLIFCAMLSSFIPTSFYDYRPAKIVLDNLESDNIDLVHLPFDDNSIESLSCMHVIEHIGLGRYGDKFDINGDYKAMKELQRVLKPNGNLLIVVPVGKESIHYNAHRVYSYDSIISGFDKLKLIEFSLIQGEGDNGIIKNASPELVINETFGCGCFWFTKK